jgi:SAM-dependent methyltransferase
MIPENKTYVHTSKVHNLTSPGIVVPILIDLFDPKSVLDVGCGIGTWLHCFHEQGVEDIFGIDGDFVDRSLLTEYVEEKVFAPLDLSRAFTLDRKFDMVISLEVAEHLPENSADDFITSLCTHSDLVIFSAAIPGQGGQNHINEQWMDYWIKKFAVHHFKHYDIMRPLLWNISEVDWWYKQNMLVFSTRTLENTQCPIQNMIHPDLFNQNLDYITYLQQYVNELETKL